MYNLHGLPKFGMAVTVRFLITYKDFHLVCSLTRAVSHTSYKNFCSQYVSHFACIWQSLSPITLYMIFHNQIKIKFWFIARKGC